MKAPKLLKRALPASIHGGEPTPEADVLVTGNYKLSFDALRRELPGLNAWILLLDTKGINVWCAAGKGTFGTTELIRSLAVTRLEAVVSHRRLILPQLGAVGVSASEVKRQTGFKVSFGPVRARDLPDYIAAVKRPRKLALSSSRCWTGSS